MGSSRETTPDPDASPEWIELRRQWSLGYNERGWKGLLGVISRRFCLEKLHLSLDAGAGSEMIADIVRIDGSEYVMPWLTRAYKRIFSPVLRELKGKLEDFHILLCWSIEAQAEESVERIVLGDAWNPARNGKVGYYERDKRNPHWKILEEEGVENRRTLTGLENSKMFEMDEKALVMWLQGPRGGTLT